MKQAKIYSLLLGGLSRAADFPGLERQVVPSPEDIEVAAQTILRISIKIGGGDRDTSVSLGLGDSADQEWPAPRRYSVEVLDIIPPAELYAGLVQALLDVAPLPSGIISDWTVRIALEDEKGERVADRLWLIPRGGGRRRFLSPSGMGGIALGGLAGAALGGPIGLVVGAALGGAAGEALERQFPSAPAPKPRRA
jgi:hypothetical protein